MRYREEFEKLTNEPLIRKYQAGNLEAHLIGIANAQHMVFRSNPDDVERALWIIIEEPPGVRSLSADVISSCTRFLFGRFEATLLATNIPGQVTG